MTLKILGPIRAALSWDPRDIGSQKENMLLDPEYLRFCLSELSWDLADLVSWTSIMSLYFEDHLHPTKFYFWISISMCCLRLSTIENFNRIFIQPVCVELKSAPCWFLFTLFYYSSVVSRMCYKGTERTPHQFIKYDSLRL